MPAAEEKRTKAERSRVLGQLVQVPGGVYLGGEDPLDLLGVRVSSVASASAPAQWMTAPRGCSAGTSARSFSSASRSETSQAAIVDLCAQLFELCLQLLRPLGLGAAPADQEQVAGAVALGQVAGDEGAEAAGGAGDQDRCLGVDRLGEREHDLADVAALPEVAEGPRRLAHVPGCGRGVMQGSRSSSPATSVEDLPASLGTRFDQVEGQVGDAWVLLLQLLWVADVRLAHLQEAAAPRQEGERCVDELAGEGVQDDVDSLIAVGDLQELLLEVEVARGGDVVWSRPIAFEDLPLGGAGGGEDLGAEVLGDPDRRHPDAAGAGVDQDPLARFQLGQVVQAVEGGGEDDRHRRGLLGGPALRDLVRKSRSVVAIGPKASGIRPITRSPGERSVTSEPTSDHDSGSLAADRRPLPG